jgi:hypothetical protein
MCCPVGCLPCGHTYWRTGQHDYGCCGATICNVQAWEYTQLQMGNWFSEETKWKERVEQWLEAEQEFNSAAAKAARDDELRERLRSKEKVRVRHVTREDQHTVDPVHQRAKVR